MILITMGVENKSEVGICLKIKSAPDSLQIEICAGQS